MLIIKVNILVNDHTIVTSLFILTSENARNGSLQSNVHYSGRDSVGDVLEVHGVALHQHADADHGIDRSGEGEEAGGVGELEGCDGERSD